MVDRDELLARLDAAQLYAHFDIELHEEGDQYKAYCPFHDDSGRPNLHVSSAGLFFCFSCGAKGDAFDLIIYMRRPSHRSPLPERTRSEFADAARWLGTFVGLPPAAPRRDRRPAVEPVNPAVVEPWVASLWEHHPDVLRFLREQRGLGDGTIRDFRLGYDDTSRRVTIPVLDADGMIVNVRKYLPGAGARAAKMISYAAGYGQNRRMNVRSHAHERIVLCAGEMDYLKARDVGIDCADSFTAGESSVPLDLLSDFAGKPVYIWYDNDDAGREGSQKLAAALYGVGAQPRIVQWAAGFPDGYDLTDLCVAEGYGLDECEATLAAATAWRPPSPSPTVVPDALDVSLAEASRAEYANQRTRLRVRAFVSGKDSYPYLAPFEVEYRCPTVGGGGKVCEDCPLLAHAGALNIQLTGQHEQLIRSVGCSDTQQVATLKEVLRMAPGCRYAKVQVASRQNLELVRLSPTLDVTRVPGNLDEEYVQRFAYVRNRLDIDPNRSYVFVGYTGAAKDQQVAHVFDEVIDLDDDAARFALTDPLRAALAGAFQPRVGQSVRQKMEEIAADLSRNVHEVYDRSDLQYAYDLVTHSLGYGFSFRGRHLNRSWVECLVVGDSGQGKTTLAESLLRHYQAGSYVTGEGARITGLLGSCHQYGTNWRIHWGAHPNNDMGMLVIDELHALEPRYFAELSTARSSGYASIRKVTGGTTRARVRLMALANAAGGERLGSFAHGVQAVVDLVPNVEDIRRFDFALTLASGEVRTTVINAAVHEPVRHVCTPDLCHALVMWAWSRRAHQVHFEEEAELLALRTAEVLSQKYSADCPLVEPADQRQKLARLAAAVAARVFSTEDGETLIVRPEHVEFVHWFLEQAYDKPSMAYDEYSLERQTASELRDGMAQDIAREFHGFRFAGKSERSGWSTLIETLRSLGQTFQFRQLCEVLGVSDVDGKQLMQALRRWNLIRVTHSGYRKTQRFINWLRIAHTFEAEQPAEGPVRLV